MAKITIIKIVPYGRMVVKEIDSDLKSLQEEVGGLITLAPIFDEFEDNGIDIFADDEGLLKENPVLSLVKLGKNGIENGIVGNVVLCGHDNAGCTIGLTKEQLIFIRNSIRICTLRSETGKYSMGITFLFNEEDEHE